MSPEDPCVSGWNALGKHYLAGRSSVVEHVPLVPRSDFKVDFVIYI